MKKNGIGVSEGIAFSKVMILKNEEPDVTKKDVQDTALEIEKYHSAIEKTVDQLQNLHDETKKRINEETAEIFSAHQLIADDPEIKSRVYHTIDTDKVNAEFALMEVSKEFQEMFLNIGDDYFKERAADVMDVANRILRNIQNISVVDLSVINEEVILIAHDLTPSETAQINADFVKGFITDIGGKTSHSAIIARQMGIPAVCGLGDISSTAKNEDTVLVDGKSGEVILNPTKETVELFMKKQKELLKEKELLKKYLNQETKTLDNHKFKLYANISSSKQIDKVLERGAEGIGLFRTEFLYLDRDKLPTEEEQFAEYKLALTKMNGKSVVIRTLDIGGDKQLDYLNLPNEMNPFLGKRAIRLCFDQLDIFKTQLRALLRASVYGNLKIMFPMIATIEEFRKAKSILNDVKKELITEGIDVSETVEVGIMVEIPSVAITADVFAKEVDFFSIGTNDLIQYTFAADRMNQDLDYLYQPLHPSILRMISMVVESAKKENIWVGMCGEVPSDIYAIPLLVALDVEEMSMSSTKILKTRKLISRLNKTELSDLLEKATASESFSEVKELVQEELQWKKLLK